MWHYDDDNTVRSIGLYLKTDEIRDGQLQKQNKEV